MNKKVVFTLISFLLLIILYITVSIDYTYNIKLNSKKDLVQNIQTLIDEKKKFTENIAELLANKQKIVEIMKKGSYEDFYKKNFFINNFQKYDFQQLAIHIVTAEGKQAYLSWTKKTLDQNILDARPDLAQLLHHPKKTSNISVGLFDITFKAISPIYDSKHHFLGLFEVITHFNSIARVLQKNNILSVLAVDKRFYKQLKKHATRRTFVQNYYISTKLSKTTKKLLNKYTIQYFLQTDKYKYVYLNDYINGFYTTTFPIINDKNETLAYYIAYKKDIYHLHLKKNIIYIIIIILLFLFLLSIYFINQEEKAKIRLIETLDKRVQEEVQKNLYLAYQDDLTDTYNKSKFEIDKFSKNESEVIMLNIKSFTKINQVYGFDKGDYILQKTALTLKTLLKRDIYRIDADEFLFFSNTYESDIEQIRHYFLSRTIDIELIKIRVFFSFAVSSTLNKKYILRNLSVALEEAKQNPFKKFVYYYQEKETNSQNFIKFNNLLYDAISNANKDVQLVPFYQPIYDNQTKSIYKYEVLARLVTPDAFYTPYYFIDIAKSGGFIHELTKIIIEKSFAYLERLNDKSISFSINITETDLESGLLASYIQKMLTQYNIHPNQITLEILEGITNNGSKNNIAQLQELKKMGLKLAIDDFGVEYSNFERLSTIDVDFIKIDGKYIKEIHTNNKSYIITKTITEFAHAMNIKVVAEFVENKTIQKLVEELNIEFSQGYYFSEPKKVIS